MIDGAELAFEPQGGAPEEGGACSLGHHAIAPFLQ